MTYQSAQPAAATPEHHEAPKLKVYTERQLGQIAQLAELDEEHRFAIQVVAKVLPFRVNQFVLDELIDWSNVPEDPMFQLTFPQPGMLPEGDFERMAELVRSDASDAEIKALAKEIRDGLNPHPAGQQLMNVPRLDGRIMEGMQHKYRETLLFFPAQGQTCHAYCSFCFRWPQFVGDKELRFSSTDVEDLHAYLLAHTEVTDVLFTGGDPMVMKTKHLSQYLLPLLEPQYDHVQDLRIGTKALTFWPQRFTTDPDADELLEIFRKFAEAGKHVALMAHFNHWRELEPELTREAIRRLREVGVTIRSQGPLLANINDSADVWARMWREQVRLGIIPYYMFVERDTGAKRYFEVPLARAWEIYRDAMQQVSGIARTARGPSMSAGPGKVEIQGVTEINGEKVFALRFIQGRNANWVQRPFFAKYDDKATWLDPLKPAFGEEKFFFQAEYDQMLATALKGTH